MLALSAISQCKRPQTDPSFTSNLNRFSRKVKVSSNSRITNEKPNHQAILPLLRFNLSVAEELTVEPVESTALVANTVVPHVSDLSNVHERGMVRFRRRECEWNRRLDQ